MANKVLALAAALLFAGCAYQYEAREGQPVPAHMPQAQDQCRAQPDLDWCPRER